MTLVPGFDARGAARAEWRRLRLYLLWQLPGWIALALALAWLVLAVDLPLWIALAGLALYVAKDFALYPAMRTIFRTARPAAPVGQVGEAVERLAPGGYVRVGSELWRAQAREGEVPAGVRVAIREARGLTLIVERDDPPSPSDEHR